MAEGMGMIGKQISARMLTLVGSLILPLVSVAATSSTTYDTASTTTTAPATIAQHTTAVDPFSGGGASLQSMGGGQARSLLALSGSLVAPMTGTYVFRQGTFADDAIGWKGNYLKGKQWAGENPLTTPNYAKRYGLPAENTKPHWVTGGKTTGPYTTRPAPPSHNSPINTGGGPEILPKDPNSVRLDWFHMLDD